MGACNAGFADCDGNPANGCELNVRGTDVNHCGVRGELLVDVPEIDRATFDVQWR